MEYNSTYKGYITGLKGFACVMVMVGHFLGVFVYAEKIPIDIHYFLAIRNSRIGFLLDESYWLYLFFIVSGYLLAFSKIEKLYQLFAKWIQRFFRLGLPILFAYSICYIIYLTIGFHNGETSVFFDNGWYQKAYAGDYSLLTVFRSPIDVLILGKSSLNSPYWVLREMFVASLIIYAADYILNKFSQRPIGRLLTVIGTLFIALLFNHLLDSNIIVFCVLGAILCWCEKDIHILLEKQWFYFGILIIALAISVLDKSYMKQLFFLALIICVPKIGILNNVFSSKLFEFIGNISFGIYSFHWPLYCSVGGLVIVCLAAQTGLLISIILAMVISFILTIILSWLYHISCEKLSGFITKQIYTILCRPFSENRKNI